MAGQTCVNGACMVVPLLSFQFGTAPVSKGVFTSPPIGLTIACPTAGRTSQTSPSTIVSGLGPNTWRAHSVDGATFGLLVERATVAMPVPVNPASSGGDWEPYPAMATVTANFAAGPDGAMTATRIQMVSGQYGPVTLPGPVGPYTFSLWALRNGGGTAYWHRVTDGTHNVSVPVTGYGASWVRASISFASSATGAVGAFDARMTGNPSYDGSPVDIVSAWNQAEAGLYPTSNIAGARAADVLSGDATKLVPSGNLDWQLQIAPNFAQGEQGADAPLIWLDASNQVFLRASDSKVCVEIGGAVVLTSAALTFSRNQAITVHVIDSPSQGLLMSVLGATSGSGLVSGTAAPMSTPGTVFVLGSSAGAQECFDLQGISVLTPS
jgi:hypothetical protein